MTRSAFPHGPNAMTVNGIAKMSDNMSIAWRLDGADDAPVILLSNSLGTTHTMWDRQMPDFASRFRVLRYDTRGHGASSVPLGGYGLDRLGRDAVELLDTLKIQRAHFCGVSLGGMTGQWLGVHAADRLDRLVLANTAPYMGPPSAWQHRIETVLDVGSGGMATIADAVIERWFTADFLAAEPALIVKIRTELIACSEQGYAGCCAAIRDMDLRPILQLIDRPTLVITGLSDPATPPDQGAAIARAIPGAHCIDLDAAHLSNIEHPTAFNAAVLSFLN